LRGDDGNDTITGGTSGDALFGGNGNDTLDGGASAGDTISGGDGDDVIVQRVGNGILRGGAGDDTISAGVDNDLLIGDAGDDTLFGGTGSDTMNGQDGDDLLAGGTGAANIDTYLFGPGSEIDRVQDYQEGENINLIGGLGLDEVTLSRSGDDLRIRSDLDAGDVMILLDFYGLGLTQVTIEGELVPAP
jgi:Ca2+-binding RTX toxin-like protein